jgi:uncharacterized protein (TIGR03032 family)
MSSPDSPAQSPRIRVRATGDFLSWLAAADGTLLVSTYNSGKLFALALRDGRLRVRAFKFMRPMGMAVNGPRFALAVRQELLVYAAQSRRASDPDGVVEYRLIECHVTGRVDAHDLAFGRKGLFFVNTRHNCLARPSARVQFVRSWQPPFMTQNVARDCCHLNGLGMRAGLPAMATAFCQGAEPKSWKALNRFESGVMIDIVANQVVAEGLCMPHSPRRYHGAWWLCDSGRGLLCRWDERSGRCETVAVLPGFTRGLGFAAQRAIVGLSKIREKHILDAPPIRERCAEPIAGVGLVDVTRGAVTGVLEFVAGGAEVYEVALLPGVHDLRLTQPAAPPAT